ncbi:MAG: hypothetical protein ABJB47_21525 [Actinomycetota bacterium]
MATNWETLGSLGTAAGTLVLAISTFASVRSANRAARAAERSLLAGLRPLLMPSRLQDAPQKVMFGDRHWVVAPGGQGVAQVGREETTIEGELAEADVVYLVLSLRNAGTGLGVLHGWRFAPYRMLLGQEHPSPEWRVQTRDLYIPPGDIGFWQGAIRDPDDPQYEIAKKVVEGRQDVTIDLLYGDYEGGQRVETRIGLVSRERHDKPEEEVWIASVSRHHNVDRPDPRSAGQAALANPPAAPWRAALFRNAGRRRHTDDRA